MTEESSFLPRHILCPFDFSDLSGLALKYAAVAAQAFEATIHVIHAEPADLPRYFLQSQAQQLMDNLAAKRDQLKRELTTHVEHVLGSKARELKVQFSVVDAHPVRAILDWTQKAEIDLIVMGTHGHGGIQRFRLGSVTENIVEGATVPVFTARQMSHQFVDVADSDAVPHLSRILCPSNISATAAVALRHAAALARRFGAELTVLHIQESQKDRDPAQDQKRLHDWVDEHMPHTSYRFEPRVLTGQPAQEIISFAREQKTDLIVLGARHQPFLEATFFGKTTELVMRHASCPALITPRFLAS